MTVKQLIDELEKMPGDVDVLFNGREQMIIAKVFYREEVCEECSRKQGKEVIHKNVCLSVLR